MVLVLRCPASEAEVRKLLPSLEIVLAAHASDAAPQGGSSAASASGKHDLNAITIPAAHQADLVSLGEQTYVVWKPTLHLTRPRARLQRPAVYFTANLSISVQSLTALCKPEKDYLTPFEPLSANVLEPLNFDPVSRGKDIYLSEDRITKVAPKVVSRKDDAVKPVRGASKRAFPTMPALFTRIRYSAVPGGVIASVHVETSQVIAGTFDVHDINLDVLAPDAEDAVDLSPEDMRGPEDETEPDNENVTKKVNDAVQSLTTMAWPLQMRAGDETVLLYMLKPKPGSEATSDQWTISVALRASATLDQGSQILLDISWQSQASLTQTVHEPTYKWSRPLTTSDPTSTDSAQRLTGADSGVTFYFSGPPTAHQNGDVQLKVKCINKSSRPRNFAVMPLRQKNPEAAKQQRASVEDGNLIAGIFNAPLPERQKVPDVLCDTPETRIGPLPSGAVFETELNYRVLALGVLDLGTIRIVDLDTEQTVNVKELPDIIALEATTDDSGPYKPPGTVPRPDDKIAKQMEAASLQWYKETDEWMANGRALLEETLVSL